MELEPLNLLKYQSSTGSPGQCAEWFPGKYDV